MTIPDYQSLMAPLLRLGRDSNPVRLIDAYDALAAEFKLTPEERAEMLPSGRQATFNNRVGWARTYLSKAGLLDTSERGRFKITDRGREALSQTDAPIDAKYLRRFPEFLEFIGRSETIAASETQLAPESGTPEERLESAYGELLRGLALDLLERVKQNSPRYFEQLVVDVIVAMGYGGSRPDAGKALGRSGDGGIDGIINEDPLGLDVIYLQAKRWQGAVGRPIVQAFVGSLEGHRARKGVMITTSTFSADAKEYVRQIDKRVILIDGERLSELMIKHGVGVTREREIALMKIDLDYFEDS